MRKLNLNLGLHPKQVEVLSGLTEEGEIPKVVSLRAGRGFGKSHLIRRAAVKDCLAYPFDIPKNTSKPVVSILGQHNTALTQIHWNALVAECLGSLSPLVRKIYPQERRIEFIGRRPDLILRGLGKGALGDGLRGLSFYKTYVDEAQEVDLIGLYDEIISPRMEIPGSSFMFIYTPKGQFNPTALMEKRILDKAVPGRAYHFSSYDNPYRDNEELDRLRLTLPTKKFQQEILAEYVSFDSQIFVHFDSNKHTNKKPESSYLCYYISVDNGSMNPAIVVFGLYYGLDGLLKVDVVDAWHNISGETVTVARFTREIIDRNLTYKPFRIYVPDDRPDVYQTLIDQWGCDNADLKSRRDPGPIARADIINRLFFNNSLFICRMANQAYEHEQHLIKEISSYHRKTKMGMIFDEIADNQSDHLVDALAYGISPVVMSDLYAFFGSAG